LSFVSQSCTGKKKKKKRKKEKKERKKKSHLAPPSLSLSLSRGATKIVITQVQKA